MRESIIQRVGVYTHLLKSIIFLRCGSVWAGPPRWLRVQTRMGATGVRWCTAQLNGNSRCTVQIGLPRASPTSGKNIFEFFDCGQADRRLLCISRRTLFSSSLSALALRVIVLERGTEIFLCVVVLLPVGDDCKQVEYSNGSTSKRRLFCCSGSLAQRDAMAMVITDTAE